MKDQCRISSRPKGLFGNFEKYISRSRGSTGFFKSVISCEQYMNIFLQPENETLLP